MKTCEKCPAEVRRGKRFCSHKCYWESLKGEGSPRWKGGSTNFQGYRRISQGNGRSTIFEHRLLMAQHLDRPLEPGETVHHINGDRRKPGLRTSADAVDRTTSWHSQLEKSSPHR